jgi:hypothetical protein
MSDLAEPTATPSWIEGESIIALEKDGSPGEVTVKRITSLSPDTVKRRYPHFVVQLSPNRLGMKLKNALAIAAGKTP